MPAISGNFLSQSILRGSRASSLILLSAIVAVAVAAPKKIMPLGDSRTAGPDSRDCYRLYLDRMMTASGYSFDFVGTQKNQDPMGGPSGGPVLPDSVFDVDHQGMWGWTTEYILHNPSYPDSVWGKQNIGTWARLTKPDIVLALLGTTDMFETDLSGDAKYTRIVQRITRVIDTLRSVNPSIVILLANLYPLMDSARNIDITAFNPRIPQIVTQKTTTASPMIFVDTWTGFSQSMLVDPLHANKAGSIQIAQRWLQAIWPLLGTTPPVSVRSWEKAPRSVTLRDEEMLRPWESPTMFTLTGRMVQPRQETRFTVGIERTDSYYLRIVTAR